MMKNVLALAALLCLFSCSQKADKKTRFMQYYQTLPELKLPLVADSYSELKGMEVANDTTFAEFKEDVFWILGKNKINDSLYAIVSLYPGDETFPILTTYNIHGKEISSLSLLNFSGDGYESDGSSHVVMDEKLNITITDSIQTYLRDDSKQGEPIIEKSRRNKVLIHKYKVSPTGIIVAQR